MLLSKLQKLLVGLSFLCCTSVFAVPLTVDVAGVPSIGLFGDVNNVVFSFDVGADKTVIGISYDVSLTAFDPSFLSEISLAVTNSSASSGVFLTPGFGNDLSGTGTFAGLLDVAAAGLTFSVGTDGILRLEFFDAFDDPEVFPDGRWNFGTVTFSFADDNDVPEPASGLLIGAGLAGIGYATRRRRIILKPLPVAIAKLTA